MDDVGVRADELGDRRASSRPGFPVDPHRVRRALWSGKRWLIGATLLGGFLGFLTAKVLMGDAYKATAVLRYEGDPRIAGLETSSGYPLGPAADALTSESLLRKLQDEIGYKGSLISLRNKISYHPDYIAGTLSISGVASTSEGAARFVHTITDVFLKYHRERLARRIEQEMSRIAKRIEGAEGEAADARRRYNEFREKYGIADLSSEQQSIVDSAAKLRADSELAAAEMRALRAQVASLEEQLANTPKTSVIQGGVSPEREAYNRLRQELASARASLSPDHPRVQSLQLQVEQLRSQIRGGGEGSGLIGASTTHQNISTELRKAKSELTVIEERQRGLANLADQAQRRVESFSGIEGEASALLAEVEVNDSLVSRLRGTEAALGDALEQTPSGFSVLDPGVAPEFPVKSKAKRIVFLAISMLFVLAALLYVLGREFRGFRAQTPAEIAFWGSGPVLAATPWPIDPIGLDELIAGLDDLAPDARGTLLVLSGTPEDAFLARDLARRMNDDWFLDGLTSVAPSASSTKPQPSTPITTPPPSGPYPVGGAPRRSVAPTQPATALALRPVQLVRREPQVRLEAWEGPFEGQALRRAARLADRVIVLVRSNGMTALAINQIRRRIGREGGIGYIVLALPDDLGTLPDRVGNVVEFWKAGA